MTEKFGADYFLRGQELGISGYTDYRWMPELTIPMVAAMVSHLHIEPSDTVLDFGCARGYVVRAFREMGYEAFGYDVSKWAIENADPKVRDCCTCDPAGMFGDAKFDWVIAKDVLEHIKSLNEALDQLVTTARRGVFVVVPLGWDDMGQQYVVPEYEKDKTHIHRLGLSNWVKVFARPGWSVEARYRVRGVKDNYAQYPTGNGFITCRRLDS